MPGRGLLRPRLLAPLALLALLAATLLQPGPVQAQSTSDKAASSDKRSEIPFRKEATPGVDSTRWALGVGLATLAGVGVLWWLRRRHPAALQGLWPQAGPGAPARRLKLVESLRVSPRSTLLLVEVDGRSLLIAEQAGVLRLLSPMTPTTPTTPTTEPDLG